VGQAIVFASNPYGTGGQSYTWLTSQQGTGAWFTYVAKQVIGINAPFSSTGFWYLGNSSGTATWYVASIEGIDVNAPNMMYAMVNGNNLPQTMPINSGLYMNSQYVGFYDSTLGGFRSYISSGGVFQFYGDANNNISWNNTLLNITATQFKLSTPNLLIDSTAANNGQIRIGAATSFTTGLGFYADGAGNWRVGNPAGNNISWNGSILNIVGTVTGGGTFSGNLSGAGGTFAGNLSAAGGTFSGVVAASSFTAATANFAGGISIGNGGSGPLGASLTFATSGLFSQPSITSDGLGSLSIFGSKAMIIASGAPSTDITLNPGRNVVISGPLNVTGAISSQGINVAMVETGAVPTSSDIRPAGTIRLV
jgi:hypothetical protein